MLSLAKAVVALIPLITVALANYPDAPGLARDTAPTSQYTFDINTGPELQTETSEKLAPDLEFTTDGGVPYSMPYDYQRIGSDGKLHICVHGIFRSPRPHQALCYFRMSTWSRLWRTSSGNVFQNGEWMRSLRRMHHSSGFSIVHAKGAGAHGYFVATNAEFAKNYTIMYVDRGH